MLLASQAPLRKPAINRLPRDEEQRGGLSGFLQRFGAEEIQSGRLDFTLVLVQGAVKAFTAVTATEPDCAMGYWGVAMSRWYPLWYPPNAAALKAGSEAVEKAMAAKQKTDRESDYIAAIATFYRDNDKIDHLTRAVAYEKAMEQVHLRYPDDREAGVFYSLALVATAPPTDKTYAIRKRRARSWRQYGRNSPTIPGSRIT